MNLKLILENIDVLLDGEFVLAKADYKLNYVGSSNQMIIDVKKSLDEKREILYIDNDKVLKDSNL